GGGGRGGGGRGGGGARGGGEVGSGVGGGGGGVGMRCGFVRQSQNEALALSSRIAVMNAGRIEQLDEPSRLYGFPRNRFVADFIGKINLFSGEIVAVDDERVRLRAAGLGEIEARSAAGLRPGTPATLALRPEQVRIAASGA